MLTGNLHRSYKETGDYPTDYQETTPPPKPLRVPRSQTEAYVQWWQTKVNLPTISNYPKHAAAAKRLINAGVTLEELPDLYDHCASWADSTDLTLMASQLDKWRAKQTAPKPPKAPKKSQDELDREYFRNFV